MLSHQKDDIEVFISEDNISLLLDANFILNYLKKGFYTWVEFKNNVVCRLTASEGKNHHSLNSNLPNIF